MAQRKHLDDFYVVELLDDLECGSTQLEVSAELGITQASSPGFGNDSQDDGNVVCYSTGRPELQRRIGTGIWRLLPKKQTGTASDLSRAALQLPVRPVQGRPCVAQTLRAHWSVCS
ncbi:uncharacterized protein TNCV_1204881 [Trichonephila clavipes]|nr:uncharacterized protein TNCV_1204881 [Trichonephila clavipes]